MSIQKQIQTEQILKSDLTHFALVLCLFLLLPACSLNKSINESKTEPKLTIGATAIDFTLKSSKNENIRLNELRGNLVLINFWAPLSGSSTRLLPKFETLYQKYKQQNFVVLSINIDPATSHNAIQKLNPDHLILLDEGKQVSLRYGVVTVPSIFLVDRSGKIVLALEGFDPRYHDIIENKIETLLNTDLTRNK